MQVHTYACSLLRIDDRHAYTLTDVARISGTSEGALRQRMSRGTLESYREHGRVYVYLDAYADDVHAAALGERGRDHDLVDELRDRVRYVERQVEEERDARRRADTLLARLMDRMPELEAPAETPEASETVEKEPERAELRSSTGDPQTTRVETEERRGFWSKLFGGP